MQTLLITGPGGAGSSTVAAATALRLQDAGSRCVLLSTRPPAVPGLADVPSYPKWVAAAKQVDVLEAGPDGRARRVHFVLDAGAFTDDYVLEYTWDGDSRVSWTLVQGQMQKSQEGSYALRDLGGSTEVTYAITIDLAIPMLGLIKRRAEKVILDTALKELKKRVEG